jgi:drug/metabolite transporter (DMT)-like permease
MGSSAALFGKIKLVFNNGGLLFVRGLVGVLIFREPLPLTGLVGAGMILASCAAVIQMNRRPSFSTPNV